METAFLKRIKAASWLWACAFASLLVGAAWWMDNYPSPDSWLREVGFAIELPAGMIVGMFALLIPGGFHNHGSYFKAVPFLTWAFYAVLFRVFIAVRQAKRSR